ncbi:MAG: helix-turn-helix domain-containing protein [Chloroflexota bacterium]|nr:helix-turn-helix domain-containing protein [Chloroflexota bacterium]
MDRVLLRLDEVREALAIGQSKLYQLIDSGEIPVVRIGRAVRVPRAEVERWITEHLTPGKGE